MSRATSPLIRVIGEGLIAPGDNTEQHYVNLDNAATTPASEAAMESVNEVLQSYGSVHRGSGVKSVISTDVYEGALHMIRDFVGGHDDDIVVVASNTTTAINRLARSWGFDPHGIVLISELEHSSNDLPWRQHARVVRIRSTPDGRLDLDDLRKKLKQHGGKVRLVAMTGASNVSGYLPPIRAAARLAHEYGAEVFVDCAQLVAHRPIEMRTSTGDDDLDYVAFSGHKMYAPFGAGVVVGRRKAFDKQPPDLPGGGTVDMTTADDQVWTSLPGRLMPGTPNVVGVVAMATVMHEIARLGFGAIVEHERELVETGLRILGSVPAVKLHGQDAFAQGEDRLPIFPFTVNEYPNGIVAAVLGHEFNIAVRQGHLCQYEFMRRELRVTPERQRQVVEDLVQRHAKTSMYGMVRASCGLSTTVQDLELLGDALRTLIADGPRLDYQSDSQSGEYLPVRQSDYHASLVPKALRFLVDASCDAHHGRTGESS